jgi:16S rRNA (uracil1498-N3)-methyltransferase
MAAFYVDPEDVDERELCLVDEEAHHVKVRRYREGDEVEAIDGAGMGYRARITSMAPKRVCAEIVERQPERGESPVQLHLAAAVPKGARFDLVIEKGTEVGVAAFRPLLTERGVARPDGKSRGDRWERLARAGAKQCGRSRVPAIAAPASPEAVLADLPAACRLLVAGPAGGGDLGDAVGMGAEPVALFIGPEGGFDPAEMALLTDRGARAFTWGERTLRAETAAVVLAALVLHEAGRRAGKESCS